MTAQVILIRDYLPICGVPPCFDEPARVIVLPIVRVERCPTGGDAPCRQEDDGLPSDCQP